MNTKIIAKLFDLAVFCIFGYFAITYYQQYTTTLDIIAAYKFDLVYVATVVFVMLRRRDINTVTLAVTILIIKILSRLLLFNTHGMSGFIVYPLLLLMDLLAVYLLWFRPVIFSKYGGPFKNKPGYAITNQDEVMWVLYGLNGIFMLLMTLEHASRKINTWLYENSRLLYNSYETIQFLFMVGGLVVLYYMTHDNSKAQRSTRKRNKKIQRIAD